MMVKLQRETNNLIVTISTISSSLRKTLIVNYLLNDSHHKRLTQQQHGSKFKHDSTTYGDNEITEIRYNLSKREIIYRMI